MGIKQPTDLLLQALSEKGADQICMHLRWRARGCEGNVGEGVLQGAHTHTEEHLSERTHAAVLGEHYCRVLLGRC